MKKPRSQLLPFLLLALILLAGYFSPTLFGFLSPDFMNEEEGVEIAGSDGPLYLENTDRLLLPPWDRIDIKNAVPFREQYPDKIHIDYLANFNVRVNHWISRLYPEAKPKRNVLYSGMMDNMKVSDGTYLFVQAHPYIGQDQREYLLDMVVDERDFSPLYLHLRVADQYTAPMHDEDTLVSNARTLMQDLHWLFAADPQTSVYISEDFLQYFPPTRPATAYFSDLFEAWSAQLSPPNNLVREKAESTYSADALLHAIYNYQDVYTFTYDSETLLVLTDIENRAYSLFFDGISNRITGYCVDAEPPEAYKTERFSTEIAE